MDTKELTIRLIGLGYKKTRFAAAIGMKPSTLYHWKEVPMVVERVVELLERVAELEGTK